MICERADPISGELRTLAIGIGSLEFERYVGEATAIDHFVNFAALKHVDPSAIRRP